MCVLHHAINTEILMPEYVWVQQIAVVLLVIKSFN